MDPQHDVLIIFHAVTAIPNPQPQPSTATGVGGHFRDPMMVEEYGPIIELDWYAYDVRKCIADTDGSGHHKVRPNEWFQISRETERVTGLTQEDVNSGASLREVLTKFNEYCFCNFIRENKSFSLVTLGDELLTNILPSQIKDLNLKLPQHYFTYFDLLHEFKRFYHQTSEIRSIKEMLQYIRLDEHPLECLGKTECRSMVRVVNKLVKDSHKFISPKILDPKFQVISGTHDPMAGKRQNYKKWSGYIRSRTPEAFRNPCRKYMIKLRGLPYNAREPEIMEFLRGLRVRKENVAFHFDHDGKFIGEAVVKLLNESDYKEALSFHLSELDDRLIEVFESQDEEFKTAYHSQFPDSRVPLRDGNFEIEKDVGIIKIAGLPLSATEEDIRIFLSGFQVKTDGIRRSIVNGKPSGEAFVLFDSLSEAQRAQTLNNEKICNKFIEIHISSHREYESFISHNFINSAPNYSRDRMPNIPLEKRKNTLLMTGLPFDVTIDDLINFFKNFNVLKEDIHMISNHSGKFSGNALITFEDEMDAQKALKTKHLTYIRNRYVELFEYR